MEKIINPKDAPKAIAPFSQVLHKEKSLFISGLRTNLSQKFSAEIKSATYKK